MDGCCSRSLGSLALPEGPSRKSTVPSPSFPSGFCELHRGYSLPRCHHQSPLCSGYDRDPIHIYPSYPFHQKSSASWFDRGKVHLEHSTSPDLSIGNFLNSLGKFDSIEDALQIFYVVPHRNVFTWTALISRFTDYGKFNEALKLYRCMQGEDVKPNAYTFVSLIKACGSLSDLDSGKEFHADAKSRGFDSNIFIGNSLITMYGKCGDIVNAEHVFIGLPQRDLVSWNAMLSVYVEDCDGEKAIRTYRQMYEEGIKPNDRSFVVALQACCLLQEQSDGTIGIGHGIYFLELGQAMHAEIRRTFSKNVFVMNALISMYAKSGNINDLVNMFSSACKVDEVSWNTLIYAYVEHGLEGTALQLYSEMRRAGFFPDAWTFVVVLQACYKMAEKDVYGVGSQSVNVPLSISWALHADVVDAGVGSDVYVGTTLIKLYGRCATSLEAELSFSRLRDPSIISWNAMLSAYIDLHEYRKCLDLFERISREGKAFNEESLVIALQACSRLAEHVPMIDGISTKSMSLIFGHLIQNEALKRGFDCSTSVGNAFINMFRKCGSISCCEKVFYNLFHRDIVSWTTMLSAYTENGSLEKALDVFGLMKEENVILGEITLVCILQACSKLASLEMCMHAHFMVVSSGHDQNLLVANTLIDAYGSCADMVDAQAVFDSLPAPTTISWSALIIGYSQVGHYAKTIQNLENMLETNNKPNEVTIQAILSLCSHTGTMDQCIEYVYKLIYYDLVIDIRHCTSIVDLLGRAGDFSKVSEALMLMHPSHEIWMSVLGACQKYGNLELGKYAFDHALSLNPKKAAAYVLMSNVSELCKQSEYALNVETHCPDLSACSS